ncbi:UDP-N-acetylmuramate dehydrogenase [Hyphococcus lacteus]|uniref:UDP-N-acetylenolpyruvoylglucosamine reductase n=1 Tax=Hyphococcus lacteus TaxID=3143536 RepID=A0ABV3Z690_9PROT
MTKVTVKTLPDVRGKYVENADLSTLTWFRVGGFADVLFSPADEDDLAHFLRATPTNIPIFVMGVGSNLLVRDGGVRGVVIRLGSGFRQVVVDGLKVTAGAGAIDAQVAKRAAEAGVAGLEFFRGVPGTIGGALRMNAGAYGGETKDVLVSAVAFDRAGKRHVLSNTEMGFSYRHSDAPEELIFTSATFEGQRGDSKDIIARMDQISAQREETQPIRERTGGSTFANPDAALSGGRKSWQLIDEIGARGRVIGDAQVSERHCNFMINRGNASAADLEELIESLRIDVQEKLGVELRWEIRRVGEATQ